MGLAIRSAELGADRAEIIRFLQENLTERSNDLRFDWLYLQNPCDQARAWLAVDDVNGRIVGVATAFPRLMWTSGKKERGWVLGDFCIEPGRRSLGPAVQLQRACLNALASEAPLWYDLPSGTMMAVYSRLGLATIGKQIRYVRLNKIDNKVRAYVAQKSLAKGISFVGNLALRLQSMSYTHPTAENIQVSVHEGAFGAEFSELDALLAANYPFRGVRSAEYLNWRYRQNPFTEYQVLVARLGTKLLGYAILELGEADWFLADLQAIDQENAVPSLLTYVHELLRVSNVDRLNAPVMEESPLVPHLRNAGFHPRESLPVVAGLASQQTSDTLSGNHWCLMHGDRES